MRLSLALLLAVPFAAHAMCRCHEARVPRCADAGATRRITVKIDLSVENGTVEVVTQSGPYHVPVADLDGKTVLFVVMPKGEVFQGFLQDALTVQAGTMQGATATIATAPVFAPGEYELLLFVDA